MSLWKLINGLLSFGHNTKHFRDSTENMTVHSPENVYEFFMWMSILVYRFLQTSSQWS